MVRRDNAWTELGANLVGSDGVKVAQSDSGNVSLVFQVLEDLQRDEVVFVGIVLPVKLLFFLRVQLEGGWIWKWTGLEEIDACGCHAFHAFLDRGEDCRPRGVHAFEDAPFCGP